MNRQSAGSDSSLENILENSDGNNKEGAEKRPDTPPPPPPHSSQEEGPAARGVEGIG